MEDCLLWSFLTIQEQYSLVYPLQRREEDFFIDGKA